MGFRPSQLICIINIIHIIKINTSDIALSHYCAIIVLNFNEAGGDMTNIGDTVIKEYMSEVDEKIEDDKSEIRFRQILSLLGTFWYLFSLSINLFFSMCLVLFVATLFLVDESVLNAVREATNEELLAAIGTFLTVSFGLVVCTLSIFITFKIKKFFRDVKKERQEKEQGRIDLIQTIIQINEELLLRHKLIEQEVGSNGKIID